MSAGDGLAALDAITGEFELVGVGRSARAHELRIGGAAVARLDATGSSGTASHARTRDGAWDFEGEGVLRPHVVVREVGSGEEVASLRSKGITGAKGTVQLGGRELAYHTEGVLSDTGCCSRTKFRSSRWLATPTATTRDLRFAACRRAPTGHRMLRRRAELGRRSCRDRHELRQRAFRARGATRSA